MRFWPRSLLARLLLVVLSGLLLAIHIALDILDPGNKAVNYSLSFHSPE